MLKEDPYSTRFPGGESYEDLVQRLESSVVDMEQQVRFGVASEAC
jgi:broad specificity phosphatase PhoE